MKAMIKYVGIAVSGETKFEKETVYVSICIVSF